GAAKNVIALAAGGVDGLGLGDNAKAGVITRGVAEMTRLGSATGARPETFAGLAGMGDLMVTCWSRLGRNRRAGELIARGATPEQAIAEIGQVVEGVTTAPILRKLARRLGIELPIAEAVCAVLEGASLQALAASLMDERRGERLQARSLEHGAHRLRDRQLDAEPTCELAQDRGRGHALDHLPDLGDRLLRRRPTGDQLAGAPVAAEAA